MLPRKTPGNGALRDNWTFLSPKAGDQWHAYLAGQPWWFLCHATAGRRSKPCLHDLTDGALPCPFCPSPSYWWGYCPLFRESDHRPVLVGLREYSAEAVSKIPRCARVLVARPKSEFDAVTVVRVGTERYQTARADRQVAPDLAPFLLRMWSVPGLESWCRGFRPPGADAAPEGRDDGALPPGGGDPVRGDQPDRAGVVDDPREADPRWLRAVEENRRLRGGGAKLPPTAGELNGFHPRE